MKNPYEVLNISQDVSKEEIHKAFIKTQVDNISSKKYTGKELMEAQKQLMHPGKRLVADFLFPSRIKSKRLKLIDLKGLGIEDSAINEIDEDALDSLNSCVDYV